MKNDNYETLGINDKEADRIVRIISDTIPISCQIWNSSLELVNCNEAAVRLYNLSGKEEYISRFDELSPEYQPDGKESSKEARRLIKKAFDEGFCQFEWLRQTLEGEQIPCEITLARVKYKDDYVVAGYTRDLREMKAAFDEAQKAKELLDETKYLSEYELLKYTLANDALNIAMWDMENMSDDPVNRNDAIRFSQKYREMLGFTDESDFPDTFSSWTQRVHPEDLGRVYAEIMAHINDFTGKTPFDTEYRLMLKNGQYRYFRSFGKSQRNTDGVAIRSAGALMDIDERIHTQNQRNEALEKLGRREKMLSALNEMALAFLSHKAEKFEDIMNKGLKPLTDAVGVSRVAIYRLLDGKSSLGQIYLWQGETIPLEEKLTVLPQIPSVLKWIELVTENGSHNANVEDMAEYAAEFLRPLGVKSMFSVPIYEYGKLWGIVTLEDHTHYRYFDGDCLDLLQSAAHLCASAVMRDEMERGITAEKDFIRGIIDAAPTGIVIRDEQYNIADCNDAFLSIFGDYNKEYYFKNYAALVPGYQPDGQPSAEKMRQNHVRALNGEVLTLDWLFLSPAGDEIPCELKLTRVRYNNKYMVLTYIYDLRNIKKMEREVAEAETTQIMLDSVPLSCTLIGRDHSIIDCNKEAERLFGASSKHDFIDRFFSFSPETQPDGQKSTDKVHIYFEKTFEEGYCRFEWMHKDAAGAPIPSEVTLVRVKYKDSDIIAGYTRDLRRLKAAEAERREADMRTQMMFDATPLGANLWNRDIQNIRTNDEAARLFGLPGKQEYLDNFFMLSPEYQPDGSLSSERAVELVRKAFDTGYLQFEWMHQTLDGTPVPCEITLIRMKDKDDYVVAGYTRDLREMKAAIAEMEKAIEEKTALSNLGNILNGLDAMVCVTDPATYKILFINDYMKRHYGIEEDVTGQVCYRVINGGAGRQCDLCPCPQLDREPDKIIIWEKQDDATGHIYRNISRYISWPGGQAVHVRHSVDITELVTAKEAAEESNRSKGVFLAHMSHEIRTPMNAILGISEIQLYDKSLPAVAEEGFKKIYDSGNLLLNIINDILDFSKIEAGKLEIVADKYDVPSLINDAVQINRLRYESKPIEFLPELDENTPLELIGDELRIKQILNNLLSNAFKYTESGQVNLSVRCEGAQGSPEAALIFRVSDTGQGMSQDQIGRLFDEYARFNMEKNRGITGTGLGMNITKNLIDMMSGSMHVESEIDAGTVFTVRLPQKSCGEAVCGAEISAQIRNFSFNDTKISKRAQIIHEYMPYGKVLVVDDMESNLYVAKGLLLPYGLNIETVSSGFEAIEKIKADDRYDIIFMDHMMPKMDGMEATKIIRGMGYSKPVVALTANAVLGQSAIFLANGFDAFLSKPIDSRELDLLLKELIRDKTPLELKEFPPSRKTSDIEKFFIRDAESAVNALKNIYAKREELQDKDIESYTITVHGIKSALANIGEKRLSAFALKLEQAVKEGKLSVISDETPAFIYELEVLAGKLKPAGLAEEEQEDTDFLRKKLLDIKQACGIYDSRAAKKSLSDLKERAWRREISDVLDEISAYLLHSEFQEAEAAAENAVNGVC